MDCGGKGREEATALTQAAHTKMGVLKVGGEWSGMRGQVNSTWDWVSFKGRRKRDSRRIPRLGELAGSSKNSLWVLLGSEYLSAPQGDIGGGRSRMEREIWESAQIGI